jgi:hypothetical protein
VIHVDPLGIDAERRECVTLRCEILIDGRNPGVVASTKVVYEPGLIVGPGVS